MIKKILKIIFIVLLSIVVIYSGIIIIQKLIWNEETPSIFGLKNYIVLSRKYGTYY